MKKHHLLKFASVGLIAACTSPRAMVAPSPPPPHPAASPSALAIDTTVTTPSGATFTASKGWLVTKAADRIVLEDPEKSVRVTFVAEEEQNADKAILRAWKKVDPAFARVADQTTKPPAKDGWDEVTQTTFVTRDDEARIVVALAQRKGKTSYVALIDGSRAGFDKRAAQLMTSILSFKGKGIAEESFKGRTARRLDAEAIATLASFVEEARAKANVPGLSIGVVQNGKSVFERGFGVTEHGKAASVTPRTLFMIGSTTKPLTTLLMARLVDAKKLTWDAPLVSLLPSFSLGDADVSKRVTLRHTVCACTGMPRRDMDLIFEYAGVPPEARIASMRSMVPTTGFGETFQYSNLLVAAGGYAAAHVAAKGANLRNAYETALASEVTGPLGMTATTTNFDVARRADHASPHGVDGDGGVRALPLAMEEGVSSVAPAGAAWSNVVDMEKVLLAELSGGVLPSGSRFVSHASLLERRKPQVKITDTSSYGLGLFVEDDHGVRVVGHGGNNLGFTTDMFFLPDHDTGVVLLSNSGGAANTVRAAVRRKVLELLFEGKPEAAGMLDFGLTRSAETRKKEVVKVRTTPDPAWVAAWLGRYKSPELGIITLRREGAKIILDVGEWTSAVGQKVEADGTAKWALLDAPWAGGFELAVKDVGGRRSLALEMPQHTYAFDRVP